MNAASDALAGQPAVLELRLDVVAVQQGDEVDAYLLGARRLALAVVRAAAEQLLHRVDHGGDTLVALGLPLREQAEDRKSTRLNSSHEWISYAVFCLRHK